MPDKVRPILVFDSGLGGLTVLAEIAKALPDAELVYAADTAGFPYGELGPEAMTERVQTVMNRLIAETNPALVVIACNTASTLVLPELRARHKIPFVGTVPAVKPATLRTRSGLISLLATPGTVARDYTRDLVRSFADGCDVTLVGAPHLAEMAERKFIHGHVDVQAVAEEIRPAFVERDGRRTDTIVLACTHFPLLLEELEQAAPWPVAWIDPSSAIARRAAHLVEEMGLGAAVRGGTRRALITSAPAAAFEAALARFGLPCPEVLPIPFVRAAAAV